MPHREHVRGGPPLKMTPNQKRVYADRLRLLLDVAEDVTDGSRNHGRSFVGWQEIADYLNSIKVKTGLGRSIKPTMVQSWYYRRGFPGSYIAPKFQVMVTEMQILAWLWAYSHYRRDISHKKLPKACLCICCEHEPRTPNV